MLSTTIKIQKNVRAMGVINITPNSFSDGGKFNSPESFISQVEFLAKWGVTVFDIGAESTAPFNQSIAAEEELARFNAILLPVLNSFPSSSTLSIDTYRGTTFSSLYNIIHQFRPDLSLIWNDVSGVIDDELWQTLANCPDARYIFCHTLTPSRQLSSQHMDFLLDGTKEIVSAVHQRFVEVSRLFNHNKLKHRLLLDPCFGFSKSFEQNLELLSQIDNILSLETEHIPLVLGISRKSFIKKSIQHCDESTELGRSDLQVELMQSAILPQLINRLGVSRETYIRLHHPAVFNAALWAICL